MAKLEDVGSYKIYLWFISSWQKLVEFGSKVLFLGLRLVALEIFESLFYFLISIIENFFKALGEVGILTMLVKNVRFFLF